MTSLTKEDIIPKDDLVENGEVPTRSEDENPGLKKRNNRLSTISQKYDTGNKGYLDEGEAVLRRYDSANAGELSNADVKKIVQDLLEEQKQKDVLKKIAGAAVLVSLLVILCNFGLVWTALIITREVETKNGSLVDSTGKKVSTKVGEHVVAKKNPEFARRLLKLQGRRALSKVGLDGDFDYHVEYRRLVEEVPLASLQETQDGIQTLFLEYVDGAPITIMLNADGTTETAQVASGATFDHRVGEDCDVYDNIKDRNNEFGGPYRVECCGAETECQVFDAGSHNNRRLSHRKLEPTNAQELEYNSAHVAANVLSDDSLGRLSNQVSTNRFLRRGIENDAEIRRYGEATLSVNEITRMLRSIEDMRPVQWPATFRTTLLWGDTVPHTDAKVSGEEFEEDEEVMFVCLENNEGAYFQIGEDKIPARKGTMVKFAGNRILHNTVVPSGTEVRLLGPIGSRDLEEVGATFYCSTHMDCPDGQGMSYCDFVLGLCVQPPSNDCFSPMSSIIEKSKGVMPIKDLKHGDSVLAANGKFQPYVFSPHSSPSKPTEFVKIHTDSSKDSSAPLEVSSNHFVFLHDKDLPVPAGKVKVGDLMIGIDGPVTVTNISSVTRNGFYNALTGDATLFVDGILASSTTTLNEEGEEYVSFGPFLVHHHTLSSRVAAPLLYSQCNMVTSYFCKTQVDDGTGGTLNVWVSIARYVLTLPRVLQGLIFPSVAAILAVGMVSYYLALVLGAGTIVFGIQFLALKCENKKKGKMA